jgi:hypothetical protein
VGGVVGAMDMFVVEFPGGRAPAPAPHVPPIVSLLDKKNTTLHVSKMFPCVSHIV